MVIHTMNNISIIIRTLFAVTLFKHSPLTRRVFFNSIRREREAFIINNIRRTASSISSWNTHWRIYKSSEVLFIDNIAILKGMQSSSASICISVKLIHHHHHHRTRLAHHNNTRLALRHSYQAGSTVLVSSHSLALRHSTQVGSKILVLLYLTTIWSEAGY